MPDENEFDANEDFNASGWDAIDAALHPAYGDMEPLHWGTVVPYSLGGNDPIQGISAYRSTRQSPHLHYITYGISELYEKEFDDPDVSGYGFELTFRLAADPEESPPNWALNFLQNLGRYVFQTGNRFGVGHTLPLNGPIQTGSPTKIHAVTFVLDPELGRIETPNGSVEFLQIVGLTRDELDAILVWNSESFTDLMRDRNGLLLTDLARASLLDDPAFRAQVDEGAARDGASSTSLFGNDMARITFDDAGCELSVGTLVARDLSRRLSARIPFGRPFAILLEEGSIRFEPGDRFAWRSDDDTVALTLTVDQSRELARMLASRAGRYSDPSLPGLTLVIEPTPIRDNDGNVVETVG